MVLADVVIYAGRFVVYSTVVFAALTPLAGLACKARWGGLKETRGGRCAVSIALFHSYLRNSHFILAVFLPFMLLALPALNSLKPKPMGKIFGGGKILPQRRMFEYQETRFRKESKREKS